MSFGPEPPYVSEAGSNRWTIERCSGLRGPLRAIGFRRFPFSSSASLNSRRPMSSAEMARVAAQLRDLGIAFGFGRDWSPSEVVQQLRDEGLFKGSFNELSWTRQGWQIRAV